MSVWRDHLSVCLARHLVFVTGCIVMNGRVFENIHLPPVIWNSRKTKCRLLSFWEFRWRCAVEVKTVFGSSLTQHCHFVLWSYGRLSAWFCRDVSRCVLTGCSSFLEASHWKSGGTEENITLSSENFLCKLHHPCRSCTFSNAHPINMKHPISVHVNVRNAQNHHVPVDEFF